MGKLVEEIRMKKNRLYIIIALLLCCAVALVFGIVVISHNKTNPEQAEKTTVAENSELDNKNNSQDNTSAQSESEGDDTITILMVDDDESNQRVVDRFEKLGAKVIVVSKFEGVDVNDYDALIIPGGHNVTPSLYGEEMTQYTSDTNLDKDMTQIAAVMSFAVQKKPIFGICRGSQLLNVAFGGTIDQGNGKYHKGWHEVRIAEDSLFYPVYGDSCNTYHYHKQQVKDLAPGFVATQWATDKNDIIEGYEHESLPIYGLQWHCDAVKMGKEGEKACQAFIDVIKEQKGISE